MPANFKQGDAVQQKLPKPIAGDVIDIGMHEGELSYKVRYGHVADGAEMTRWFKESDLEPAPKE